MSRLSRTGWFAPLLLTLSVAAGLGAVEEPRAAMIAGGLLLLGALSIRPATLVVLWIASVAFIPVWIVAEIGPLYLGVATLLGLPVLALLTLRQGRKKIVLPDLVLPALIAYAVVANIYLGSPSYALKELVTLWAVGYALGRSASGPTGLWLARVAIICAIWSITEFVTDWHPFATLIGASPAENSWATIQTRGPFSRSEAAFGHSIALGGMLALAVPFVSRYTRRPALGLTILGIGVLATLSRAAFLAFVVTWTLEQFAMRKKSKASPGRILAPAAMGVMIYTILQYLESTSAAEHLQASTAYRELTLARTLRSVNLIGLADGASTQSDTGMLEFSGIYTVDNTLLFLALEFGLLFALTVAAVWITLTFQALKPSSQAATIALVGQWPLILAVAPITQWQVMLLFVAGMAVTQADRSRRTRSPLSPSAGRPPHQSLNGADSIRAPFDRNEIAESEENPEVEISHSMGRS